MTPRFSIVIRHDAPGYTAIVTDYSTNPERSALTTPFPTAAAAQAEADRCVARWRYGTDAVMAGRAGAA